MEVELLETLPNGREIYRRTKKNAKVFKAEAIKIHKNWIASGQKGNKPLFQDIKGQLWEIEGGGKTFRTAANPEGYRFGNWAKHFKRGLQRRGIEKLATPTLEEVARVTAKMFPDISAKDNLEFATRLFELNEEEITKTLAARKLGQHTDHLEPLAKGGVNWFTNLKNIEAQLNLQKSGKPLSTFIEGVEDTPWKGLTREGWIGKISSNINWEKDSKAFEDLLSNSFKKNSATRKVINNTIKGVGAAGTTLLKTTAEVVADPLTTYTGTVEALNQQKSLPERAVGAIKATEGITGMAGWFSKAIRPTSIHLGAAVSYAELSDTTDLKEKAGDKFQRDVVTGTSTFGFGRNPFEGIFNKDSNTYNRYNE